MAAFDRRTSILAAATLALVAAGIVGLVSLSDEAAPAPAVLQGPSTAPVASYAGSVEAQKAVLPPIIAASNPWTADETVATVLRRYHEAKDLRDFYDRAIQVGGQAHLWVAQTVLLRCSQVTRLGMVGAQQLYAAVDWKDAFGAARVEAQREWTRPCAGFETRPVPEGELRRNFESLRDSPTLVGEGFRLNQRSMSRGDAASIEEQKAFLHKVIESGEPDLIGTFGANAAQLRFGPYRYGGDAASTESNRRILAEQRAWLLAGCDLGKDCGRGSTTWMNACMGTGDCSDTNAASGAAMEVGCEAMPGVLKRKEEILAALKAKDWAALGL